MYVYHNIATRLRNNCCYGNAIRHSFITYDLQRSC